MMDFTLTEEQKLLKETARHFAEKHILPYWRSLRKNQFPRDIHFKMVADGYAGATIPKEYGGAGLDQVSFAVIAEDLCCADAGVGLSIGATLMLVAEPILRFGTEEQKKQWLPEIAKGAIGAYAQTEPGAGSDISAIRTKGEFVGDAVLVPGKNEFLDAVRPEIAITGEKTFITNGSIANVAIVIVRTSEDKYKGLTMVLVDVKKAMRENALTVRVLEKAGLHSSPTTSMVFQGCRVPRSNVLGEIGRGFMQATATLTGSRPFIGVQGVGIAQAAFDSALAHVLQREQFGKKLAEHKDIQRDLAEMAVAIEAARLLVYRAARAVDETPVAEREKIAGLASMAKLYAARAATFCAEKSANLHGGTGFMAESRIAAIRADASAIPIYEGAEHIQLGIIARHLLAPHGIKVNFNA